MTWSLGKNPDPRVVLVLRTLRGVPVGATQGGGREEREAWVSTFLSAGEEALARRDFQDAIFREPEPSGPRFRIRGYWALVAFGACSIGGFVIGQLERPGYVSRGRYDNDLINAVALTIAGVLIGIAVAAAVLLGKFAIFAGRPLREKVAQKMLEERFGQLDPARRTEAVKQVLSGADRIEVAQSFGVALESLDAWGAVFLDAAQGGLKQRFGAAS